VTNEESIQRDVQAAFIKFGRIDVLLNSAGVVTYGFTVSKEGVLDNKELWRVIMINVIGTINVSKYVAKHWIGEKEQTERVIVNVASVAGIEASRGMVAYGLSKGAVIGATLPMARDLGKFFKNINYFKIQHQSCNSCAIYFYHSNGEP